jgi:hypothetical protein
LPLHQLEHSIRKKRQEQDKPDLALMNSILIVWLYVGRNLIRRLMRLSDSMLAPVEQPTKFDLAINLKTVPAQIRP